MFNICFCANESYIKYTAVLIANIIKATDLHKNFSDFFSKSTTTNGGGNRINYR